MKITKYWRILYPTTAIVAAAGATFVACSQVDTVTPGDSYPATQVAGCGTLDPTQAAQLATVSLEHFGSVALAALAGLENSRAAARLLTFGDGRQLKVFVTDSQSDLHDALVELRDKQLVASNVESTTAASVTFRLNPQTICESDATQGSVLSPTPVGGNSSLGGAGGVGGMIATGGTSSLLDPACVKRQTEHPSRIRVSRIACDQGDNIAIEYLYGSSNERILLAELYAERAEIELNLGGFLRSVTVTTSTSVRDPNGNYTEQTTTKPLVSSATGVLRGTLNLTGSNQATGKVSVAEAIDVTTADESATRLRLAPGTDQASITADGTAKTIRVQANVGALDWRARFQDFAESVFGLVTSDNSTQDPIDMHIAGLRGTLNFDGARDVVTIDGLDHGGAPALATQGARTLVSVTATNTSHGALAVVLSGRADENLGLALASGLAVDIKYGLEPVMSALQNPANYLARDELTFGVADGTTLTLFQQAEMDDLAITSSQTGRLLRVETGTMTVSSSQWPSDTVTVTATQCMARTPTAVTGHNDLLDDFTVGSCSQ